MNIKANKQKKDLIIKMIKELAEFYKKVPKEASNKLKYLLNGFLRDTLDFEKAILYIDNNLKEAKEIPMKAFWAQVVGVVRRYFDESKKLK